VDCEEWSVDSGGQKSLPCSWTEEPGQAVQLPSLVKEGCPEGGVVGAVDEG
jgi:hypothetical protein